MHPKKARPHKMQSGFLRAGNPDESGRPSAWDPPRRTTPEPFYLISFNLFIIR